jgi:pimeloyl-ACP methyl ester carboxylesterase
MPGWRLNRIGKQKADTYVICYLEVYLLYIIRNKCNSNIGMMRWIEFEDLSKMKKLRTYGKKPFIAAVIHGGPGAPGEMAPVAKELSRICGVLEPLQTEASIDGQIQELKTVLEKHGNLPIILIGHSWGAWLSFMFTAKYSLFIKKLILVASGPFEEKYVPIINETRSKRLSEAENLRVKELTARLTEQTGDRREIFSEFGKLMSKVDSFKPIVNDEPDRSEIIEVQPEIFGNVMEEAINLRKSGELLRIGKRIECPVVAIHGDCDPHPFEGVEIPLRQVIKDFRFILLKDCGHNPWSEVFAKDEFYQILKNELS